MCREEEGGSYCGTHAIAGTPPLFEGRGESFLVATKKGNVIGNDR